MNKKIFAGLVVLMGISIAGIFVVQLVWMNNAIRVKNELFSRSVNDALNNTIKKLEDQHHLSVVSRMVLNDSLEWDSQDLDVKFHFETMPPPPPLPDTFLKPHRPVRIIQRQKAKGKNEHIEVIVEPVPEGLDSMPRLHPRLQSKKVVSNVISKGKKSVSSDSIIFIQDTIIYNVDSFYTLGMEKIDSLLHRLDTAATILPDISNRVKQKAGNMKRVASQAMTEIISWDTEDVDKELVNTILTEELRNRDIPIRFDFGILHDSILDSDLPSADLLQLISSEYQADLYPNAIFDRGLKLAVVFPGREGFILRSLNWLLIASLIFSLSILTAFALSIFYILRQKKISEMKSDFINNMTHEFKTPIATISVAADSINNEKVITTAEKVRYFTDMIKKENARMNRQVEDILTIARLDRKDFEFKWETIDIHDLLKEAIQGIVLQVEKRGGKIGTRFGASNPSITTDKNHCTNVFYNLLDNAMKYSAGAPKITITTANKNKGVLISVEDKGIGMTKSVQSKIFERFYRQQSGNIHNVKGFGLGLSYAKAVVAANRGTISVQSEPGKGSKFIVFLPFVRE